MVNKIIFIDHTGKWLREDLVCQVDETVGIRTGETGVASIS